jgi:DNA-binding NarL/FixJ family response regulator
MPVSELPTVNGRPRVLLADDRPERRAIMRMVVQTGESGGDVVAEATSPASAVAAAGRTQPDVAVVEIQIPVAVGLATIAALRAEQPELTIVVCSFRADLATQAEAFAVGATTYLTKPVSARDLHHACRTRVPAPSRASAAAVG